MAKLIYSGLTSLDGYTVDADGVFDWAAPSDEVHAFVNDLERPVGTYLYGRAMYEVMRYWETAGRAGDESAVGKDYAGIWQAADKIVYSRTLEAADTTRTRVERSFDPDAVRRLKETADRDITVGGTELGGQAIAAGLVDVIQQFLSPVVVGGGKRFLPDGVRLDLELVDERRFTGGVVFLDYRVVNAG